MGLCTSHPRFLHVFGVVEGPYLPLERVPHVLSGGVHSNDAPPVDGFRSHTFLTSDVRAVRLFSNDPKFSDLTYHVEVTLASGTKQFFRVDDVFHLKNTLDSATACRFNVDHAGVDWTAYGMVKYWREYRLPARPVVPPHASL